MTPFPCSKLILTQDSKAKNIFVVSSKNHLIKQNIKNILYISRPSDHEDKAVEVKENTEEERLITIFSNFLAPEDYTELFLGFSARVE